MSAEDRHSALIVAVNLCTLPVVLVLAGKISSLELHQHFIQVPCYATEHGFKGDVKCHPALCFQGIYPTSKQGRYEVIIVRSPSKALFQRLFSSGKQFLSCSLFFRCFRTTPRCIFWPGK